MKLCSRCNIEKDDSAFRVRTDKRRNPPLVYLNNTCYDCDAETQRERVRKQRQTPEGRKKHNQWANKSYHRHRDDRVRKMREKRKTPEYKAKMKEYRENNKQKIYQQEVITKKRYHEKNRDAVTDEYVIGRLIQQGYKREECTPELIELKRVKILKKRLKNKIAKLKKK